MNLKLINFPLIILILFIAVAGCEKAQKMVVDPAMDETMTDAEALPVKLIWFIDYPKGGKDAYVKWVASVTPTLLAPEELVHMRGYDNSEMDTSPNRFVEFKFKSFLDAVTYLERPEIAAIREDLPNHSIAATVHTFIQRSDYAKQEAGNWKIKKIYLIDYPLGGKQAYLEWAASISQILVTPPQLKAIASYDNYYGESPHRLVELEFATLEDVDAYMELEDIKAVETEFDNQARNWVSHTFELLSGYTNE